ncbi:hypothetical protein AB0E62_12820 [Streptomyces sp. NPDC038707]|uniref:hypothetical protein n=1 Tax=Streptomyces sp. NPDC038707 TaxID=3154329 RepID=UPI0033FC1377
MLALKGDTAEEELKASAGGARRPGGFSPPEHLKQGGGDAAALTVEAQPVTQGISAPKREALFAPANQPPSRR